MDESVGDILPLYFLFAIIFAISIYKEGNTELDTIIAKNVDLAVKLFETVSD